MTKIYIEQAPPQRHPGGRPTKLTPELIDKAKGYLDTCEDTPIFTEKGAIAYVDVKLPSLEGLARYLGIHKDTIQSWCKESDENNPLVQEFSVLVKDVLNEQAARLLNNGLGGLYQPKIAGVVLSKHGYYEKTEADITTGGEKIQSASPLLPELVKTADELLRQRKLSKPDGK